MIRKIFMLAVVFSLFVYTGWNFYAKALRYDPLAEVTVRKMKQRENETFVFAKYRPAWSRDIHEKNLFTPTRGYQEPRPFVPPPPPPPPPPRKPEMVLKGIVLDSFGDYVAYIEIDKAKATPMRKGDKAEDIEVVDISGRHVVLKWNNETIDLNIDKIKTITNPRMQR